MWNTARGDVDPVPGRICREIFKTSNALARKHDRFRFGRDPRDTGTFLSSKKKRELSTQETKLPRDKFAIFISRNLASLSH